MKNCLGCAAWLVVMGQAFYVASVWNQLPVLLPSHFGLDGLPNRYAPKPILWVLVGISAMLVIVVSVALRFPGSFNLPRPPGEPDRPRLEAIAHAMLLCIRLEITCLFALLVWSIVQVGMQRSAGLWAGFTVISLAVVLSTVGYFILRMRPPQPKLSPGPAGRTAESFRRSAR